MSAVPVFQVRTTNELEAAEITELTKLFEVVYAKPCPEDLFIRKFANSPTGRAIHSLMLLDGHLIGAFSAIPAPYRYFGQTLLFATTADLMIHPQHRGPISRVQKLAAGLYDALASEGVAFVFCCLRDEIFKLHRAISGWQSIGKVSYYAAPSLAAARALLRAWNRPSHPSATEYQIEKIDDAVFTNWRYKIFPTPYQTVDLPDGGTTIYATELFYPIAGIPPQLRTGFLIDVAPLTAANFDVAIRRIREREPALSILAYQGYLRFQPREMLRIPAKYEKQSWTLAGKILLPAQVDAKIFDIAHWNINLSNGDLV